MHFWALRLKSDTQEETRLLALDMLNLVKNIDGEPFALTLKAFNL
jgi:thymidylate synthase ThyX